MAKYEILKHLHTGCSKKPRYLWPAGIIEEFDPTDARTILWVKKKALKQVPDDTPLTESSIIREKMKPLVGNNMRQSIRQHKKLKREARKRR